MSTRKWSLTKPRVSPNTISFDAAPYLHTTAHVDDTRFSAALQEAVERLRRRRHGGLFR